MINTPGAGGLDVRAVAVAFERPAQPPRFWQIGGGQRVPLPVLVDIDLRVSAGEFISIVGPSGCGKSTLLRVMAGLLPPDSGAVTLPTGESVRPGTTGYLPQRDLLLPWRSVLDNVTLGLEFAGVARAEARQRAQPLLVAWGLGGDLHAYPRALSGGMRQRVALLRTVLGGQPTLLLDEPFGALDALTRRGLHRWLHAVQADYQRSVVLVTHDVEEAVLLSNRVLVMSPRPGRIVTDIPMTWREGGEWRGDHAATLTPRFLADRARVLAALEASGGLATDGAA